MLEHIKFTVGTESNSQIGRIYFYDEEKNLANLLADNIQILEVKSAHLDGIIDQQILS